MKNQINNITKTGMLLGLTAVMALSMDQSSASAKPSHGGGSGGGFGGGSFYPTVSTVSQLVADINYANNTGGAVTINLAPGTTFDLTSANNSTDGGNGLPVIGGTTSVNLTIIGNGDTIERIAVLTRFGAVKNPFNLFDVAAGSALTLEQVTLKDGIPYTGPGRAILNHGTVDVIDGSTFSGNTSAIYNDGGTATIRDSDVSDNGIGLYNSSGTLTVSNVTVSGSTIGIYDNNGTVTINNSTLSDNFTTGYGAGILNNGGTVAISNSAISDNTAQYGGGIYNLTGTMTVSGSILSGNSAYHSDYPWTLGDGGGIYNSGGNLTISNSTISGNSADQYLGSGGGIYNGPSSTATVENDSNITGNTASDPGGDVENYGVLYLDNTSAIGALEGNSAISI